MWWWGGNVHPSDPDGAWPRQVGVSYTYLFEAPWIAHDLVSPPHGIKIPAAWLIVFQGDKIEESRHYFDMMTMLQQIEAVPATA